MQPVSSLLSLIARLPSGLTASSRETNHFELSTADEPFFLDLSECLGDTDAAFWFSPENQKFLDLVQLLLAEAAKTAEDNLLLLSELADPT